MSVEKRFFEYIVVVTLSKPFASCIRKPNDDDDNDDGNDDDDYNDNGN